MKTGLLTKSLRRIRIEPVVETLIDLLVNPGKVRTSIQADAKSVLQFKQTIGYDERAALPSRQGTAATAAA